MLRIRINGKKWVSEFNCDCDDEDSVSDCCEGWNGFGGGESLPDTDKRDNCYNCSSARSTSGGGCADSTRLTSGGEFAGSTGSISKRRFTGWLRLVDG